MRGTAFRFALEGNRNEPLAGDGAVSEKLFAASDVIASARGRLRNWVARGTPLLMWSTGRIALPAVLGRDTRDRGRRAKAGNVTYSLGVPALIYVPPPHDLYGRVTWCLASAGYRAA